MNLKIVNDKNYFQKTIKGSFILDGVLPFSGKTGRMVMTPASPDTGIAFTLGRKTISANISSLDFNSNLHTTVLRGKNSASILGVEHLLAAFAGVGVTNVKVEVDGGSEVPTVDSSADGFTRVILKKGITRQPKKQLLIEVKRPFLVSAPKGEGFAYFLPAKKCEIGALISFPNLVGQQAYELRLTPESFRKEISWARSFIRSPLDNNGSKWKKIRQLIKALPKNPKKSPLIVFDSQRYLTPLKSPDEPVRHKILDFIGDFSLLGYPLKGKVILYKPGHAFNHYLIKKLASLIQQRSWAK